MKSKENAVDYQGVSTNREPREIEETDLGISSSKEPRGVEAVTKVLALIGIQVKWGRWAEGLAGVRSIFHSSSIL